LAARKLQGYRLTVLRGSERADNPYEPLEHITDFGGSHDEHIVMLERDME
jgi:hypothetical protein